jgi:hypothetical protein
MLNWLRRAGIVALAALLWSALLHLIFWTNVGGLAPFEARSLVAYLLLVGAPAATFVPLSRWMHAPLYEVEGIAGWALLGGIVTFLPPSDPPGFGQFILFALALTVSLATIGTLMSHLVGLRMYGGTTRQVDSVRSRRQGYLAALFIVSMLLLHGAGTLAPTSVVMLLLVVVLAEMLAQAYGARGGQIVRSGLGPRRARGVEVEG